MAPGDRDAAVDEAADCEGTVAVPACKSTVVVGTGQWSALKARSSGCAPAFAALLRVGSSPSMSIGAD